MQALRCIQRFIRRHAVAITLIIASLSFAVALRVDSHQSEQAREETNRLEQEINARARGAYESCVDFRLTVRDTFVGIVSDFFRLGPTRDKVIARLKAKIDPETCVPFISGPHVDITPTPPPLPPPDTDSPEPTSTG